MSARITDGWVVVTYTGPEQAHVHIALGKPDRWRPAYLDWENGYRVAKIRLYRTGRAIPVWLNTNGIVTSAGEISTGSGGSGITAVTAAPTITGGLSKWPSISATHLPSKSR